MSTALTVYCTNTVASTIATAGSLLENVTTGASTTNKNSSVGSGVTGWGEVYALGTGTAWAAGGSIGSPDGNGYCDDSTTLETNQFASGTWTATVKMNCGAGTMSVDIHVRAYQRSSGGSYTLIADMVLTGQTLTTTATNFSPTATGVAASNTFATGDKLYVDVQVDINTNSAGGASTIKINAPATGSATGSVNAQIVTPGYQAALTNNQMSSTDALTAADTTLYVDSDIPIDALTASDLQPGLRSWTIDALTATDAALYTDVDLPIDALAAADSVLYVDADLPIDANTAADLQSALQAWPIDALTAIDAQLATDALLAIDTDMIALTLYPTTTAATTITTADVLATTLGGAAANVATTIGTSTGYGEVYSQGTSNTWAGGGSIGAASGNGWLLDSKILEGAVLVAGNWQPVLKFSVSVGSIVADLHVRIFVLSGGLYVQIGSDMVFASRTITTSASTTTWPVTSLPTQALNPGDKVYLDVWPNITTNSTGSGAATLRIQSSTTSTQGNAAAQIITPGYLPALDALLATDSDLPTDLNTIADLQSALQVWPVDALIAADLALYVDSDLPTDLNQVSDLQSALQGWPVDALTASDASIYADLDLATDALTALDSLLDASALLATDANSIADTQLATDAAGLIDQAAASDLGKIQAWPVDALIAADSGLYVDSDQAQDALVASDTSQASPAFTPTDALSAADSGLYVDTGQAQETLQAADIVLYTDLDAPIDANVVGDLQSALQAWPIDALQVLEAALYTDLDLAIDANTASDTLSANEASTFLDVSAASDALLQSDALQALDSNSVADQALYTDLDLPVDVLAANDLGKIQAWPVDALSAADSALYADLGQAQDALIALDAFLQSDALLALDALTIADLLLAVANNAPVDVLPISDSMFVVTLPGFAETASAVSFFLETDAFIPKEQLMASDLLAYLQNVPFRIEPAVVLTSFRSGQVQTTFRSATVLATFR